MNHNQYKILAKDIVDLALKKGSDTAEVTLRKKESFDVNVRKGEIETLSESESSAVNIVITKNKKKSSVSSNDLREESLASLIDNAVELTNYTEEDEFFTLPPIDELGKPEIDLKLFDHDYENISADQKIEIAKELERISLKQDSRLYTESSEFSSSNSYKVFANSLNFCEEYKKTTFTSGISLFAEDEAAGENINRKQSDLWYSTDIQFKNLDTLQNIAKKASERTLRKLGARKAKTSVLPVVFDNRMGASFISSITEAVIGSNIYKKQSFLCDQVGKILGSRNFTLIDDPLAPGRIGSRPFDNEGVKSRTNIIFENGKFEKYLLDTYSANKLNLRTTGNSGGISNLFLQKGEYDVEEIISSVDEGLFITFMSGQGINIVTGDYSRGAQGIWIRNGKLAYPISEITITSNILDIIKNISMVGNDLEFLFSINSPTFKVDKMTISGE